MAQYTIHSQSMFFPEVPNGNSIEGWTDWNRANFATKVMEGYSSSYFGTSDGSGTGQPLSSSGSCIKRFKIQPQVECDNNVCEIKGDDYSVWMSIAPNNTKTFNAFYPEGEVIYEEGKEHEVTDYISRCIVVDSIFPWLAIHSFTDEVPSCPDTYGGYRFESYKLWEGYSLISEMADQGKASSQDLTQPGSCIKHFVPTSTARCSLSGASGQPYCNFARSGAVNLYVRNSQCSSEETQTIDPYAFGDQREDMEYYVSRCVVCVIKGT